ncbi:hypothetical protein GLO73106DRAFT_00029470 [Gloeocapsa sp. PCC 73106]|nr:hypothetical protein GLO73106DRAFT_00029470 [Gloeocapsa sp. PCC 73106]
MFKSDRFINSVTRELVISYDCRKAFVRIENMTKLLKEELGRGQLNYGNTTTTNQ